MRRLPALFAAGAALAVVVAGMTVRWSRAEDLHERAAVRSVPTVAVVSPAPVKAQAIELPARIEAWSRAPIHARVGGYLRRWNVDIGGSVRAGQVLAEIETPELDQSLRQARAELSRAHGEAALAEATARRWQSLRASDSVSVQEAEERQADWLARQAHANALTASVERAQVLQQYKRLVAPFEGIVTARNTDVGALINVGTSADSELFVVSDIRRLRVYVNVNVPQRQVALVREGSKAQLVVPERPDQRYVATVQSLSQAIDTGSGAMRVQLSVDNAAGELLPGGFATVRFEAPAATGLGLPPSALIIGRSGVQVAVVEDGHESTQARLRPVRIARDLGTVVELSGGLSPADLVIDSPPDGIGDGDAVRVAVPNQEAAS